MKHFRLFIQEKYKKSSKDKSTTETRIERKEKERDAERFRVVSTNRAIKVRQRSGHYMPY